MVVTVDENTRFHANGTICTEPDECIEDMDEA
jgi:hypothetical protein